MRKLLPCPFCRGHDLDILRIAVDHQHAIAFTCLNVDCGATGPNLFVSASYAFSKQAIKDRDDDEVMAELARLWNKRAKVDNA